ncbi:phage holin family protein [Flavihumibacter sp. UBA7668]|uniref:phage holin family protein n=1 Tax=Flavihumibacter sp. UBA7668 TaxID=1946542 RepID=UPI0025BDC826|nr:phage holin family protein [Flavihumibacter sp. UBA7668]
MSEAKEPGYFEQMETLLQQYVNDRILLLKLQATEKASRIGSLALIFIVIAGLVFFMLFFISIMAGYFFAELTGSLFYGFSIVTGVYVVLVAILLLVRKKYLGPFLVNIFIRIFSEKINDQDEEAK